MDENETPLQYHLDGWKYEEPNARLDDEECVEIDVDLSEDEDLTRPLDFRWIEHVGIAAAYIHAAAGMMTLAAAIIHLILTR